MDELTFIEIPSDNMADRFGIKWSSNNACLFNEHPQCLIGNDLKEGILRIKADEQPIIQKCTTEYLGVCWVKAEPTNHSVFGFSEFVTALALLALIYTVTDVRYRF